MNMSVSHEGLLSEEQLRSLPTKRLLAYKTRMHRSYPSDDDWNLSGCDCDWCKGKQAYANELDDEIELIKKILSEREHIERKKNNHGKIHLT